MLLVLHLLALLAEGATQTHFYGGKIESGATVGGNIEVAYIASELGGKIESAAVVGGNIEVRNEP